MMSSLFCTLNSWRQLGRACTNLVNKSICSSATTFLSSPNTNESVASNQVIFKEEIAQCLSSASGDLFLDMSFGSGGHTRLILDYFPDARVIALDRDPSVHGHVEAVKAKYPNRLCFLNIKFSDVVGALSTLGIHPGELSGAVLDSGPSLDQLYNRQRGFSAGRNCFLDMRMDGPESSDTSALDIIKSIDEESLYKVLKVYGQHRRAKKLAEAIGRSRYEMVTIRTPDDLINFIKTVQGLEGATNDELHELEAIDAAQSNAPHIDAQSNNNIGRVHPVAQSTFAALRRLVNDELNELDCAIKSVHCLLEESAPFAVISYDALEDTIIKRHFTGLNVDASPESIGRPQHRDYKAAGLLQQSECNPWSGLYKAMYKKRWDQPMPHSHWKNAILRTALKNSDVTYDA